MTGHTMTRPTLVPFGESHLPGALSLSQQAGWPHRIEDWALTLSASDGVVALLEGKVGGTALCADFGPVATLNMIIVDASMRGHGLGRRLMSGVMDMAGSREMRLVATAEGLPLYEKLGFRATGQIVQHQGTAIAAEPELPVVEGGASDVERCAGIDTIASGMSRRTLLAHIADHGDVLLAPGGFALLRCFGRGHVAGPVVAEDAANARALLAEAARRCAGGFLRADLPAGLGLEDHAVSLGMAKAGGGTAMTRNAQERPARAYTTYALISQALG